MRTCQSCLVVLGLLVGSRMLVIETAAQETPLGVLADQIRNQGYPCQKPETATRDPQQSKADEPVWILKCDGVAYRVRLVPDQAAKVERVQS